MQHGFSVVREACIGRHFGLIRMLVEEHNCSLYHFWCPPADKDEFHKLLPGCDESNSDGCFGDRECRLDYLNAMFGEADNQDGNDSLKKYLMHAVESRCRLAPSGNMSSTDLSGDETGELRDFGTLQRRFPKFVQSR